MSENDLRVSVYFTRHCVCGTLSPSPSKPFRSKLAPSRSHVITSPDIKSDFFAKRSRRLRKVRCGRLAIACVRCQIVACWGGACRPPSQGFVEFALVPYTSGRYAPGRRCVCRLCRNHYRTHHLLGSGGYGSVYLVDRPLDGTCFVSKKIPVREITEVDEYSLEAETGDRTRGRTCSFFFLCTGVDSLICFPPALWPNVSVSFHCARALPLAALRFQLTSRARSGDQSLSLCCVYLTIPCQKHAGLDQTL